MIAVRLSQDLEKKLNDLAMATERSKSYYVKKALEIYLQDHTNYLIALATSERIQQGREKTYTLAEVEAMLKKREKENE